MSKTTAKVYDDEPVHWFTASCANWKTSDCLLNVLRRQHEADSSGTVKPKGFSLWRVPGDDTATYKIRDYRPDVEGAKFIANISYAK